MTEFAQTEILHRILLRIWLLRRYLMSRGRFIDLADGLMNDITLIA